MPVSVTETWRGKSKAQIGQQGDTALRIFTVVTLLDEDEDDAASAVNTSFGITIGSKYNPTDTNNVLICKSVIPRFTANNIIEVVATFDVPPCGYYQPTTNPLDLPWYFAWEPVTETQPFDRDTANNPVLNSSYDPPTNPPTRTVNWHSLTIQRNESFYNYTTYKTYENCVNSDSITLLQPDGNDTTFDPGTIKVAYIKPQKAYSKNDTYVPMEIRLEIYDQSEIDLTDPHQLHLLDQGNAGYFDNSGTNTRGNIVNVDGSQPAQDVALNGQGMPLDTTLLISPSTSGGEPQTPVACARGLPDGATLEDSGSEDFQVVYLRYERYLSIPLLPLLTGGG